MNSFLKKYNLYIFSSLVVFRVLTLIVFSLFVAGGILPEVDPYEQTAGFIGEPIAFPGAEGFGANALGGRGGKVLFVTNLNDSGAGSLRAAIEDSGPRTVIFKTSGMIVLESSLRIKNPYITIAGQTAPGDGITITHDGSIGNPGILTVETHDVVVRYIRSRPGPNTGALAVTGTCCLDAVNILKGAYDVIFDHVSMSWSVDEMFSIHDAYDVTVQWSLMSEPLACSTHSFNLDPDRNGTCPEGGTPTGAIMLIGKSKSDPLARDMSITLHHNLFAHSKGRHPNFDDGIIDFRNNVIYNPERFVSVAGDEAQINYVKNLVKSGPATDRMAALYSDRGVMTVFQGDTPEIYYSGNQIILPSPSVITQRDLDRGAIIVSSPFSSPPITETEIGILEAVVLSGVGTNLPSRDSVDSRVIADVINRTGDIIDHPTDVGGFPTLAQGVVPIDSDSDGMPDTWELSNNLNPNNGSDGNGDSDDDGYTNLEEYLNYLISGVVEVNAEVIPIVNQEQETQTVTAPSPNQTQESTIQEPETIETPVIEESIEEPAAVEEEEQYIPPVPQTVSEPQYIEVNNFVPIIEKEQVKNTLKYILNKKPIEYDAGFVSGVNSQSAAPKVIVISILILGILFLVNNNQKGILFFVFLGIIVFIVLRSVIETSPTALIRGTGFDIREFIEALKFYTGETSGVSASVIFGLILPRNVALLGVFLVLLAVLSLFFIQVIV